MKGEKGKLPEKIEKNHFWHKKEEKFKLPCEYFHEKCTIYSQKKAIICSAYRCQLLNNFSSAKLSKKEASNIIINAKKMRKEISDSYRKITGKESEIPFRSILLDIIDEYKMTSSGSNANKDLVILNARCKIFESLLIKHFKSEENFQEMFAKKN